LKIAPCNLYFAHVKLNNDRDKFEGGGCTVKTKLNSHLQSVLAFLAIFVLSLACGQGTEANQPAVDDIQPAVSGQAQAGTVLFQDDFQDGQAQEWKINSAWVVEQDGDVYTFGATGLGGAWIPFGGTWKNYSFKASAWLESGSMLFSSNLTQQGRYAVKISTQGVYLLKEQPAENYIVLAEAGPVTTSTWHVVEFASYAGHIQVSIDRVLWFDYVDTSSPILQGTIAVSALDGSRVQVDDVLVVQLGAPLTSGVAQAPPPLADAPSAEEVVQEELAGLSADQVDVEEEAAVPSQGEGSQPDLVITDIVFDPDPVIAGQPFVAEIFVMNQGGVQTSAFTVRLHFHEAVGLADCNWDFDNVGPGQVVWGGCTRTTNAPPGDSPTRATVDVEAEIPESDESNNEMTRTLSVSAGAEGGGGGQPDLIVSGVTFDPDPALLGQPFAVNYSVKNQGQGDSGIFTFRLHFNEETGLADCNWDVDGLPAGQSAWSACTRTVNVHGGNFSVRAIVDVEGEIAESNEGNNEASYTLSVQLDHSQPLPDLIVTDVKKIAVDTIQCNVKNIGAADAPAGVIVGLFVNGSPAGTATVTNPLTVGTTRTRQFSNLVVPWPIDATCVVDDPNAIVESNENNNELTKNIGP